MKKFAALGLFFLLISCGVEAINSVIDLNSPLGLTAVVTNIVYTVSGSTNTVTNKTIRIVFWAFNDETYFEGYQVCFADNLSDLTAQTNSYRALPSLDGQTNFPTLGGLVAMTEALKKTLNLTNDTNYTALQGGNTYYIHVKAYGYSLSETVYSVPSNATNVTF
ncbi:MAG: hypothetical protein HPY53_13000 [Brevinematales bacterium]|nr:hypothetical protein [Brevinematales bacterium]